MGTLADALVDAAELAGVAFLVGAEEGGHVRYRYASPQLAALLGHGREELGRLELSGLVHPDDWPVLRDLLARRAEGSRLVETVTVRARRSDGRWIHLALGVTVTDEGDASRVIAVVRDVTEEQTLISAVRASEQRVRRILELLPDAIGVLRERRLVYCNPAAVTMLGYPSIEALVSVDPAAIVHPDDLNKLVELFGAHEARRALPRHEFRVRRIDGELVVLEVAGISADFEGERALIVVARDLSERRSLEVRLRQADRLAAVGLLAAGVAHEINNPLAYVLLNLTALGRDAPKLVDEPQRLPTMVRRIDETREGIERVATIVRDLRDLARPGQEDRLLPVDVVRVVRSSMRMVAATAPARVELDMRAAPFVLGQEARLSQIIVNVLVNATQSFAESARPVHDRAVRVVVDENDDSALISVSDNGVGIPASVLPHVFDPFFTTKPVGVGTGLGLSICHSLVAAMGGEITLDSRVGAGSTVRIQLPRAAPGRVLPRPKTPTPGRARILVVDDEEMVARAIARLLERDHEVDVQISGRAALAAMLGDSPYDLVVCDLLMPDLSGIELHDRLARERPGLEKRLVFMTGASFARDAAEFLQRIQRPALEKPFGADALRDAVARAVGRSA